MCDRAVSHFRMCMQLLPFFFLALEHLALNMFCVNRVDTLCFSFIHPLSIKVQLIASLVNIP